MRATLIVVHTDPDDPIELGFEQADHRDLYPFLRIGRLTLFPTKEQLKQLRDMLMTPALAL